MRVGMYYNNHDVRVEEFSRPKISAGEILFQVKACGICGSDVLEWYRIKKAPLVLGHEAAGEIVEVAPDIKKYKVGQRVFVAHHVPCYTCHYCLAGHHTACETLHTTNYYPGGFSEYIRVPALNVERGVFLLPDELSFEEGTFIEPLACVVRGQRMANFKPGQGVLILGSGISGLLHLLLAKARGAAGRVVMTDINDYRLKMAQELGADAVINAKDDVQEGLRKANAGRLAEQVVVCTGASSAFHQALKAVDRGGTILCFAATDPEVTLPVPVNDFWRDSITITHSYGASPEDIAEAIELLRKKIVVKKMITHCLGLKDIGKGFALVAEGKDCIKVIIQPEKN